MEEKKTEDYMIVLIKILMAVALFTGLILLRAKYWQSPHDRAMRRAVFMLEARERIMGGKSEEDVRAIRNRYVRRDQARSTSA